MISVAIKGKTFSAIRSVNDNIGLVAQSFQYNAVGPPDEKVEVQINNTRYLTDIQDFEDHYANQFWSVFDINKYTNKDSEIYLIPLDTQRKEE
jgi:hypothetical protein